MKTKKIGCVVAGHSSVVAAMAGIHLPIASRPLQALVSEPIKPILDTVIMSNAVHMYISQSDKGEMVLGAGVDKYNSYAQRGSFPVPEHMLAAAVELFFLHCPTPPNCINPTTQPNKKYCLHKKTPRR